MSKKMLGRALLTGLFAATCVLLQLGCEKLMQYTCDKVFPLEED